MVHGFGRTISFWINFNFIEKISRNSNKFCFPKLFLKTLKIPNNKKYKKFT